MPEVAGDAGVLFDPYDEDAIAEALRLLLTNPAVHADYAAAALSGRRNSRGNGPPPLRWRHWSGPQEGLRGRAG